MAQGIDIWSVRVIINREISWVGSEGASKLLNMVHFAQMSGRAGHDGKSSYHHLLFSNIPSTNIQPSDDHGGQQAMIDFVSLESCWHRTLSLFLDEIDQTCLALLTAELCNICLSHSHALTPEQEFYSSPSGSHLKAQGHLAERLRPARTLALLSASARLGSPTPISQHAITQAQLRTPLCPTPHHQGAAQDDEPSGDELRATRPMQDREPESSSDEKLYCRPASGRHPEHSTSANQRVHFAHPTPSSNITHPCMHQATLGPGPSCNGSTPVTPTSYHRAPLIQPSSSHAQTRAAPRRDPAAASGLDQGLTMTLAEKVSTIGRWCERLVHKCSICMFFDMEHRHFPYNCPSKILPSTEYKVYRSSLCFTSRGFCYGCLVPDDVHKMHKNLNPKSHFFCLYDDQIRPLPYLIYTHKPMRKAVFNVMGLNPKRFINMEAYTAWLAEEEPHRDALPNIQELVCIYMKLKLNDTLPSILLGSE
ncbi:hypothetical protein C8R48DRAFT_772439 [Suillus tomentosus]|nr:hypothetical protein C8R48DRAFT_772439 [Suillus tomentosus]